MTIQNDASESILEMANGPLRGEFVSRCGIVFEELGPQRAVATMPLEGNRQPYGFLHGGATCTLVETLASMGGAIAAGMDEKIVMGMQQTTNFLGTSTEGSVRGVATPIHIGGSSHLWQVDVTHIETGKLVASGRVTLAVRNARK
ncbi:MAG: hypothetical protein NVSMB57_11270 [Actinomycetota bacterium]